MAKNLAKFVPGLSNQELLWLQYYGTIYPGEASGPLQIDIAKIIFLDAAQVEANMTSAKKEEWNKRAVWLSNFLELHEQLKRYVEDDNV